QACHVHSLLIGITLARDRPRACRCCNTSNGRARPRIALLPRPNVVLESIFPGDSELAKRLRELDWAATPLGPVEAWPPALRVAAGICLGSGFAVQLLWGPQLSLLFNDAALALFGAAHLQLLGRPAREAWRDAWPQVGPLIDRALGGAAGAAGPHQLG